MAGPNLFASSNFAAFLQNESLPSSSSHVFDSFMFHHSDHSFQESQNLPFFEGLDKKQNNTEEQYDACFHQAVEKRRLTRQRVQFLEKNSEVENMLKPERKVQLAKELRLQPRQVAIWFHNQRVQFKKHLV